MSWIGRVLGDEIEMETEKRRAREGEAKAQTELAGVRVELAGSRSLLRVREDEMNASLRIRDQLRGERDAAVRNLAVIQKAHDELLEQNATGLDRLTEACAKRDEALDLALKLTARLTRYTRARGPGGRFVKRVEPGVFRAASLGTDEVGGPTASGDKP